MLFTNLYILFLAISYSCHEVWAQNTRIQIAVAGTSTNIHMSCGIGDIYFWKINGSVYGLLNLPNEYTVCDSRSCDPNTLSIPVVLLEMDGYTFQCGRIHYHSSAVWLGDVTELRVTTLPQNGNINGEQILQRENYLSSINYIRRK